MRTRVTVGVISIYMRGMWDNTATSTYPDMRRVSWGQSAQTNTREVSFCNIANGYPINSAQRVLHNTEVKERNIYIYINIYGK